MNLLGRNGSVFLLTILLTCARAGRTQQSERKVTPPDSWEKCTKSDGSVFYAPSCSTTARITKIEKAVVEEPGTTVVDYDTCVKREKDWQEGELKDYLKKTCKQMADLDKEMGVLPGYYPGHKEPGYNITLETPLAVYVVSALGKCGNVKPDGTCDFSGGPGVVVGHSYIFDPPSRDSTVVTLAEEENGTQYARVIGYVQSVAEKSVEKPTRDKTK
jgi:hypothetical protein